MDPHTRASNLRELLTRLGLEPSTFADIAELAREQVKRWLKAETKWRSAPSMRKAASALGMTLDEFENFLDDTGMSMTAALSKAKEPIRRGLDALEQRRAVSKRARAEASRYEEATGEQTIEGLVPFAGQLVWKVAGANASEAVVRRAVSYLHEAMTEVFQRGESELKPMTDPPPHERPSGRIQKAKRH